MFKVTLGCHHLDARMVRTVCITSHLTKAAFRAAPASPFCSLYLPGKAANSSHVFTKKGGMSRKDRFYRKSYVSLWRGIKGNYRMAMLKMELFFMGGGGGGVEGGGLQGQRETGQVYL